MLAAAGLSLFATVAAACGSDAADTTTNAAPASTTAAPDAGSAAPAAQLVATAGGGQFDLASIEGKDTMLWFWAPW
jgi:hypothetical protein